MVQAIARDWRTAPLGPADRALADFAAELTATPDAMDPDNLERLRQHGFDDRAIHDCVQVVSYFNYINRVADALGVEDEKDIRAWEE